MRYWAGVDLPTLNDVLSFLVFFGKCVGDLTSYTLHWCVVFMNAEVKSGGERHLHSRKQYDLPVQEVLQSRLGCEATQTHARTHTCTQQNTALHHLLGGQNKVRKHIAVWHGLQIPSSILSYHSLLKEKRVLYSQESTDRCPKPVAKVTREAGIESDHTTSRMPLSPLWLPMWDLPAC